ncbi:hypothetical protein EDD18DRAFT_1331710 [Armillaria luteobubalina]|uniref:Uncharacterized protein n=1 Tax=Armillaria luteobubalina TaxID=153913 RepID=A0AA39UXF8_9AGAR|nr:hypothetical protein EDD18DRAFT_1331710 [Armillaria luteobubalina]
MCIPILPETAHPRSREPLKLSEALPWDHCYHPTCYDVCARIRTEWRDYSHSPYVMLSAPLVKAIPEDIRYGGLLRAGVDDERAIRILDGEEDAPEIDLPDDMFETDSQTCKTFWNVFAGQLTKFSDKPFSTFIKWKPALLEFC